MTTFLTKTVATATLIVGMAFSGAAIAASELHVEEQDWSFAGPFGKFDQAQLQRGFQIYTENCSACHSLNLLSFRNLMQEGGPGFSEAEVRAIAAEVSVLDGPDSDGEMFDRPGRLADRFPSPWANEEQDVLPIMVLTHLTSRFWQKRVLPRVGSQPLCSISSRSIRNPARIISMAF